MSTHAELLERAEELGHEVTPQLEADLLKMASVSDADILAAGRKEFARRVAADFAVPIPVAERRLDGYGPFQKQR